MFRSPNLFTMNSQVGYAGLACLLLAIAGCSSSSSSSSGDSGMLGLNDTGVDWCGDDDANNLSCPVTSFPGQDGDSGRDAAARDGDLDKLGEGDAGFDFIKLDGDGEHLPASATDHTCVLDNVTGLMWEVKQTGTGDLRYADHSYSWYNPDADVNGGDAGIEDGGFCALSDCDTHAFVNAVNAAGLCGYDDWRMPTVSELNSIMHRGVTGDVAIDTDFFPNTVADYYWTSQTSAQDGNEDRAWQFDFSIPEFSASTAWRTGKNQLKQVRLVRNTP